MRLSERADATLAEGVASALRKVIALPRGVARTRSQFNLGVDPNSVFGRLYHHLDPLYGQEKDSKGSRKAFFTPVAGVKENCISFPILEAVLASLWQQRRRDLWTLW